MAGDGGQCRSGEAVLSSTAFETKAVGPASAIFHAPRENARMGLRNFTQTPMWCPT